MIGAMKKFMALFVLMTLFAGCATNEPAQTDKDHQPKDFMIKSQSFEDGKEIPRQFACDGGDVSPQISWYSVPEKTASLALVCEDPDAPKGTFTHWIVYDILPSIPRLAEGQPRTTLTINGASQGENDTGNIGWNGPCPPPGKPHHYVFTLYALDDRISFNKPPKRSEFDSSIEEHIIAKTAYIGLYSKK